VGLVCLCCGVNERRVRREIDNGALSIADISERCRAGSCCQSCHPTLEILLAERATQVAAPRRRRFIIA